MMELKGNDRHLVANVIFRARQDEMECDVGLGPQRDRVSNVINVLEMQ